MLGCFGPEPRCQKLARLLNFLVGMKNESRMASFFRIAVAMALVLACVACGGGDDDGVDEPLHVAETAPVAELEAACTGEPTGYCEDVELELCDAVGCEIRVFEDRDYSMCAGERPRRCSPLKSERTCTGVRGCKWSE